MTGRQPETIAAEVLDACRAAGLTLATAESCTGGIIAGALTAHAGSSDVVERGFVTYANAAKSDLLDVPAALINEVGAVSEPVARAMAEGALARAPVDLAVSVTGIAGPGGATADKPLGLVHMALARRDKPTRHEEHRFTGNRAAVRRQAALAALDMVLREAGRVTEGVSR